MNFFAIIRDTFFNLNGCSSEDPSDPSEAEMDAGDEIRPGRPTNVTMEVFSNQPGSVTVSWTPPENTGFGGEGVITHYECWFHIDAKILSDGMIIGCGATCIQNFDNITGTATSFVATGLPSGKTVSCLIRCVVKDPADESKGKKKSYRSADPNPKLITVP